MVLQRSYDIPILEMRLLTRFFERRVLNRACEWPVKTFCTIINANFHESAWIPNCQLIYILSKDMECKKCNKVWLHT